MKFVKPTPEQIEKILKSDKSFRFEFRPDLDQPQYTLGKVNDSSYVVTWDGGNTCFNKQEVEGHLREHWSVAEEDLAQLEDTSKRHKYYDLIKQWIEDPDGYNVYFTTINEASIVLINPSWDPDAEGTYHLEKKKPKVKKYKVLFRGGGEFKVSNNYYKDKEEFKTASRYQFIQLIQESEKEF